MTIEAPGRIATDGEEIRPFDEEIFTKRLESLVKQKPDAITVSLLNSFANSSQYVHFSKCISQNRSCGGDSLLMLSIASRMSSKSSRKSCQILQSHCPQKFSRN